MTDGTIDIQLTSYGAELTLSDEGLVPEVWALSPAEVADLADKATQAMAEMRGWEFYTCPAIAVEPGNILAFCESPVKGCGTIRDGHITELYFEDETSMELDSSIRVTILRRIE